jgi:cyclic pyranopterin phosphate synthase
MPVDTYRRTIDYLRISVTDRCNLRCVYCMPLEGIRLLPHEEMLTYEELTFVARAAVAAGLSKIRLTGGEPLVRKDIADLVREIASIEGLRDLGLTTNGILLAEQARDLYDAGLRRINVSLDTLDPERFRQITRGGEVARVLVGIDAALEVGFDPVKINVVALRETVDTELETFMKLVYEKPVHVRFIEQMDLRGARPASFSCQELKDRLAGLVTLADDEGPRGNGPARYVKPAGALGTIGFICLYTDHFCDRCNRLRLTADGKLRTCLFAGKEIDLKSFVRSGASFDELVSFIQASLALKPENFEEAIKEGNERSMRQIGG